jgi:thioredoxin reductase (NADPH)
VRNKNIILIGSRELSTKIEKASLINNYPGIPAVSGEQLKEAFLKHIDSMGIEITEDKINAVYSLGNYFALQGQNGSYEADSVILAAGLSNVNAYPGEEEYLGQGVSYCVTCDAAFYRGKSAAVIAFSDKEEAEAKFLAEIAEKVTYIKMYKDSNGVEGTFAGIKNIEVLSAVKPVGIKKNGMKVILETQAGGSYEFDGIFVMREHVAPKTLVPGLKTEENKVLVQRDMSTNIKGLFACGDITGAPYQYVKAAGEGNVAALSAVAYLAK